MTKPLTGQVVAITGGARGIGRATAEVLIAKGAKVAIGDIEGELVAATAAELGHGTLGVHLDVTDPDSFAAFLAQTEGALGPLDILINNAGIMPLGDFVAERDSTAVATIEINLHGVIIGSKLALQRFQSRGRGHLVNVASTAGKYGAPGGATYAATKHAVVGLSEAIRQEVLDSDIRVSIVMPLVVNTELGSGLSSHGALRVMEPEDVARTIVRGIERNQVDIYAPGWIRMLLALQAILPRSITDRVIRLVGADKVLKSRDVSARSGYESHLAADAESSRTLRAH